MKSSDDMEEKEARKTSKGTFKAIALFVIIIIAAFAVAIFLKNKDSSLKLPEQSQGTTKRPAPNFTLPGLDGKMSSLADYRGKVVLLNIWATWCPSCVEEMPSMEDLYKRLKSPDFEILTVSIDESGAQAVLPFMQKFKLTFPTLVDPGGKTVQRLYRITGVPESFIIGKGGNIEKVVIGPTDWATPEAIRFFKNLIEAPQQ
jgi:cytochrome c biogenesis protein CcmG, thiol:disulfide interchange protein DsbE